MKKLHSKESYKHKAAIDVLEQWIKDNPLKFGIKDFVRTEKERLFSMKECIMFKPDITVYNKNGVCAWFEIHHTSPLINFKLSRMQWFLYVHKWDVSIYEVNAEYILKQISIPSRLLLTKFN